MITVSVAGGSRLEILALVAQAHQRYPNQLAFIVFDSVANVDTGKTWTYVQCQDEQRVVAEAVAAVASGSAQVLLKGLVQTRTLLKEVLNKAHGLKKETLLSHVAMVTLPRLGRTILLTDSAMALAPTGEELMGIIHNAKEVAHNIGMSHPKIALLSSAETLNEQMASSVLATQVTARLAAVANATVFGPISLDLALSPEAVALKGFTGPIQGDADILVVPNIDVGNVLYKSLTLFGDAVIGGLIVGTTVPIVLTSRSDTLASKLHSLDFALQQIESP